VGPRPPDPGPRPAGFEFPFAAAARALAAIDELTARWRSVARAHAQAAEVATVGFEGRTRELFDAELGVALGDCVQAVRTLEAQRERIQALVAEGHHRQEAAEADLDAWQRRQRQFVEASR
jgi:hypothetical protein